MNSAPGYIDAIADLYRMASKLACEGSSVSASCVKAAARQLEYNMTSNSKR